MFAFMLNETWGYDNEAILDFIRNVNTLLLFHLVLCQIVTFLKV